MPSPISMVNLVTFSSSIFISTMIRVISIIYMHAATVFGENRKLEPLSKEKKAMWKREMDCFLSVCDYMVEFASSPEDLQDGSTMEV